MAELEAAMAQANRTMPMDYNETMSQEQTIQWVLDTFVEEEDHEEVRM